MKAAITATAKYLPDGVMSNHDLELMLETNDEWIRSRTGISERRIMKDPDKATSFMCGEVAKQLLAKRGITAEEVELIIIATMTPDMLFPSTACFVQSIIGATKAWAFDLNAACSGFIFALNTAAQFIESGAHKNVMVIGADTVVALGSSVLGKPGSCEEAVHMLQKLQNTTHKVHTGFALLSSGNSYSECATTTVEFEPMSEHDIKRYLDRVKPFDKAGSYGIQDPLMACHVRRIDGCYYNVVGLPVSRLCLALKRYFPEI